MGRTDQTEPDVIGSRPANTLTYLIFKKMSLPQ
jgi:hypothetical protein